MGLFGLFRAFFGLGAVGRGLFGQVLRSWDAVLNADCARNGVLNADCARNGVLNADCARNGVLNARRRQGRFLGGFKLFELGAVDRGRFGRFLGPFWAVSGVSGRPGAVCKCSL